MAPGCARPRRAYPASRFGRARRASKPRVPAPARGQFAVRAGGVYRLLERRGRCALATRCSISAMCRSRSLRPARMSLRAGRPLRCLSSVPSEYRVASDSCGCRERLCPPPRRARLALQTHFFASQTYRSICSPSLAPRTRASSEGGLRSVPAVSTRQHRLQYPRCIGATGPRHGALDVLTHKGESPTWYTRNTSFSRHAYQKCSAVSSRHWPLTVC